MTPQAPQREVPGAGSPLTRAVLTGPSRPGLVLASFPTALYLSVGQHHEVLPVLASDALMLPTATRLSAAGRDVVWGVEPGDTVTVGRSAIRLPGWRVRLVREWRPARVRPVPRLAEPGLLSELADMLSCHVGTPELVDQATAVCRAARRGDDTELRRVTSQLLGAGPGLTPSGDDVLCAVLLVLCGSRGSGTDRASWALPSRTAGVAPRACPPHCSTQREGDTRCPRSAALVECALRGDLAGAREALASTLAIGHSSGAGPGRWPGRLIACPCRRPLPSSLALYGISARSHIPTSSDIPTHAHIPNRRKGKLVTDLVEVRRGAYYDSVSLMQVSKAVREVPGISAALVAMATDLNTELLAGMGFTVDEAVGPNDMLVAFRGEGEAAIEAGRSALDAALSGLRAAGASAGGFGDAPPPRTLGTAAARSGANLALISVPGANAFVDAMDAVTSGVSVVLFSDNVSIEQEIALKDAAAAADVLVMGPDCGTAVVAGVALGFANLVRAGSVGLVAASGTGAQQVMCLLDVAGVGMSHCLGVGGRDLSSAVGGSIHPPGTGRPCRRPVDRVHHRRVQTPGRRGARVGPGVCRHVGQAGPLGNPGPWSPRPHRGRGGRPRDVRGRHTGLAAVAGWGLTMKRPSPSHA